MSPEPLGRSQRLPEVDLDTPFGRLALAHVLSLAGDALVALVLAGSLFFSIDPAGARWRIALYLAFTMAPFAFVGPLIGPAMDRVKGGRQLMLSLTTGMRSIVAFTLVASAASDSLLLFPEAFLMLVLSKSYAVAKASVVPATVSDETELVEANSKLQVLGGLAAFAAGVPGGAVLLLAGPSAVALLCGVVFIAATIASLRVPRTSVAFGTDDDHHDQARATTSILSAGSGMATLRWVIGFVTFLLAFALRGSDTRPPTGMRIGHMLHQADKLDLSPVAPPGAPPVWHFGVVVACSAVGGLLGAAVAPHMRRVVREEYLLVGSLGLASLSGLAGFVVGGLAGMALLALGVAIAAAAGKQAFDAVVQRDSSESERGSLFGRFESRFQIIWVFGAALPVVITVPVAAGAGVVGVVAAAGAAFYWLGLRAVARGERPPTLPYAEVVRTKARRVVQRQRSTPAKAAEPSERPDA